MKVWWHNWLNFKETPFFCSTFSSNDVIDINAKGQQLLSVTVWQQWCSVPHAWRPCIHLVFPSPHNGHKKKVTCNKHIISRVADVNSEQADHWMTRRYNTQPSRISATHASSPSAILLIFHNSPGSVALISKSAGLPSVKQSRFPLKDNWARQNNAPEPSQMDAYPE